MSMRLRPKWLVQNSGHAMIEYALILALASLGIVSALIILQRSVGNTMQGTGLPIDAATAGEVLADEPVGSETGAGTSGPSTGAGEDDNASEDYGGHGSGRGYGGNGGPNGRK
jgi:Flp pilus assembly pilin Flp